MKERRVVIVGGGHGGGTVAAMLRQYGHTGSITIVGSETSLPYERPPLSKGVLLGEVVGADLTLRDADFYTKAQIDVRTGVRATGLDPELKQLACDDGQVLDYDVLVLATGARPRRLSLPGCEADNVLYLRDQDDADRIRRVLQPGSRLCILGGGYVGLEVAASARLRGTDVTLVERESQLLARVASPALSAFLQDRHRDAGVTIHLGQTVQAMEHIDGHVTAVRLADGGRVECDAVVVGIGAEPVSDLVAACGLNCASGVDVDDTGRTSLPDVFAVGDVSVRPVHGAPSLRRLESVPSTVEQAKQTAAAITGHPSPAPEVPWFWSDHYTFKVKIAGLIGPDDQIAVLGQNESGLTAVHLSGGRVVAVETVNRPADFMAGKKLIASGQLVESRTLNDPSASLREIARRTPVLEGA